jgi:hypothetical protein
MASDDFLDWPSLPGSGPWNTTVPEAGPLGDATYRDDDSFPASALDDPNIPDGVLETDTGFETSFFEDATSWDDESFQLTPWMMQSLLQTPLGTYRPPISFVAFYAH